MSTAAIVIPAVSAILVQALQAWIALSRIHGMSEDQLSELLKSELAKFQANTPDKLPDP